MHAHEIQNTPRPLRCVHYLSRISLADGGVVRAVLDLCTVLAARGHETTLVTWDAADVPTAWLEGEQGAPRVVVVDRPMRWGSRLGRAALATIDGLISDAQVLHLHTPWDPANVQLARQARRRGVPYVVTVHGMLDDWSMAQKAGKKRAYLALVGRRFLEGAARIHCTAEAERAQASRRLDGSRMTVVPCVIDLEPFRRLPGAGRAQQKFPGFDNGRPTVLFLSRLHYKKGVEVLIEAAGRLRDAGVACNTLIAGPSADSRYAARLEARVDAAGLDDRVWFLGMVGGEDKLSLYEAADLFVLPTSQENFGLVLLESLACGTPVVTTRGVDIWAEIEAAGAVIVEQAAAAVAEAVRGLIEDPARRCALGEAGRRWAFERFEPGRLLAEYEAMYRAAAAAS